MATNSVVMSCNCKHEFQDSKHGYGKRVFNLSGKSSKDNRDAICTVCSTKRQVKNVEANVPGT